MKKVIFNLFLSAICAAQISAQQPGTWSVISPEGILFEDISRSVNPLKGKSIDDITVTPGGQLWVAANNNVYHVKASEGGTSFDFDAIPSSANSQLIYSRSKIRPRIESGFGSGNNICVVISTSAMETGDGKDWQLIKTQSGADNIEGFEFDELTGSCASPYGSVVSGKKKNVPGIAVQEGGMGYFFLQDKTAKDLDIRTTFSFHDLNITSDKAVWALGGSGKQYLWTISGGMVHPVDFPYPILDIATDHNGRLVVATPASIVSLDRSGTVTPLLDKGASFVAFDRAGVMWYVPAGSVKEEPQPVRSGMKLSEMVKATKAGLNQPQRVDDAQPAGQVLLVRYDPATQQTHELTEDNCMIRGQIRKVLSDGNNRKYILAGDQQQEIYIFKEPAATTGNWTAVNPIFSGWEALNQNYWETACAKADGSFHAFNRIADGNNGSSSVFSGGQWSQQPCELVGMKLLTSVSGAAFAGETMYVATNTGLYTLLNGKMEPMQGIDRKAISDRILALATDRDNRLWIGSADGLASFDGKEFTWFGKKYTAGPASVRVLSLCSSGAKVFVGTTDGLSVCDQGNWTSFDKKSGLDNNRVNAVAADSKGRTFVGAVNVFGLADVLSIYENGQLTIEKIPEKIFISKMLVDSNDNLWIAGESDVVCRKADGKYVFYKAADIPQNRGYLIRNMAVVNNELHLSVSKSPKGYQPTTNTTTISTTTPIFAERTQKGLNAFDPKVQVLIMKIE